MAELVINGRFLCQPATGVQRVAREFVTALDRMLVQGEFAGTHVTLAVPRDASTSGLGLRQIAVKRFGGGHGYYWEQVVLPTRTGQAALLCLGNTAPVAALMSGRRVAVMLHDQSYRLFPGDYSLAYRSVHALIGHFILKRADPLITVSQTEAGNIRRFNPRLRRDILVAPNGSWIADSPAILQDRDPHRPVFVLHVGGFSERKNVDGVFATAIELARKGIAFRLVGRPNPRSEAFLGALDENLRSLITFTGYVDNDQLEWLYRNAACLLYPSLYEASGLPPSEAMTFGCPVIVSDLPVLRERCGRAGLFCDPTDVASMVEAILALLGDSHLSAELSRRGLEQVKAFSWEQQARIVMNALL